MTDYYASYYDDTQLGMGRRGYGGISHVYIGTPNQRGHGIGSFLGGLFRSILPFLKSGAKTVGKEMLRTGVKIASDVIDDDVPVKEAFRTRIRESGRDLKRRAEDKIETLMHGSGYIPAGLVAMDHSVVNRDTVNIRSRKKRSLSSKKKKTKTRNKKRRASAKRIVKKKKKLRTVSDIFQ